jgi:hypothetical protein
MAPDSVDSKAVQWVVLLAHTKAVKMALQQAATMAALSDYSKAGQKADMWAALMA